MLKQESHLRSVLKGISWRLIAFLDTILVVILITCFFEKCSLDLAVKIGFVEFLIKFIVYYIHERVWQFTVKYGVVTKKQTLFKSISWRIIATAMTFLITGAVLDDFNKIALYVALAELFTKFVLYYLHERIWCKIPLGRIRKLIK
ncbi:MAG: DUF2061 domain-containing protein [Flavobacteriaceae bacterium]|nr:DUF2061 domain-containing protein [Flavobacteriaceae bacterium]